MHIVVQVLANEISILCTVIASRPLQSVNTSSRKGPKAHLVLFRKSMLKFR